MSVAVCASEASIAEQANESAVLVNERTDEQVVQFLPPYSWLLCSLWESISLMTILCLSSDIHMAIDNRVTAASTSRGTLTRQS